MVTKLSNEANGQNRIKTEYIGVGVALGTSMGVVFGAAFGDVGMGIALGTSFGVIVGVVLSALKVKLEEE